MKTHNTGFHCIPTALFYIEDKWHIPHAIDLYNGSICRGMHVYTCALNLCTSMFFGPFRSNGQATGGVHSDDIVREIVADNAYPFLTRQFGGPARQVDVRVPIRLDATQGGGCEYGAQICGRCQISSE